MNYFNKVKEIVNLNIEDELLIALVLEISRFCDRSFTKEIQRIQKENGIVIDSPTRKKLRKKYYYGEHDHSNTPYYIVHCEYDEEDIELAFKDCYTRLNTYDPEKIIESMRQRIEDLHNNIETDSNGEKWLEYYEGRRAEKRYSLLSVKVNQDIFSKANYDENYVINFIRNTYNDLENYRHLAIVIEGELFNRNNECVTWNILYKAGIYAENFIQFNGKFLAFHKEEQIEKLREFLVERGVKDASKLAENYYAAISTGYKFEDCYISTNQKVKIAIYKKIELDTSNVPCPSCNTTIQRGNSFPEMFLRSWECKNPSCPDRSKSGRGKRFDEYGVYRYFKLVENNRDNTIGPELYQSFRRDVFDARNNWQEFLIKEYSYTNESIFMYNCDVDDAYKRKITQISIDKGNNPNNAVVEYSNLPIVLLFKGILENCSFNTGNRLLKKEIEIVNADSTSFLQSLKPGQIGTAITSPPYYNAREYSQWNTMIMYFVDMLLNCKAVYDTLANDSYYLYNIGDIVSEDNVYVKSNMSKRRVQLGFLSAMIFETAGYTLTGDIIWDKGEVQSKRNSTVNLFSGYVKCVNCYEHVLVFRKGKFERLSNTIEAITPVIKINSKGENTYKHTAPYPLELVELLRPYVNDKLYVLDPFLGSGTTLKWCRENNMKGIGTELNEEYYNLCMSKVYE